MKETIGKVLKTKKFVVTDLLIKLAMEYKLSLHEFLVLMYLDNSFNDNFDLELMSKTLGIDSAFVMEAFNALMVKKLVTLETSKDVDGRYNEIVNLTGIYSNIEENTIKEVKEEEKEDIFQIFERELGRTISSFEMELIDAWLKTGMSEELIVGALKEAVYNGTTNFRYIDAILHEWKKQGIKTQKDIENHLENRRKKKEEQHVSQELQDLLDSNWFDEDE